jgi:hypothetical protein
MAKATSTTEKPAFDVSLTDKRSDKRVITDYKFALTYAPEMIDIFAPYADDLDAVLAELANTEGALPVETPVDTVIAAQKALLTKRYLGVVDEETGETLEPGAYADYTLRGNAKDFFLPKKKRAVKDPIAKAKDLVANATPEQLAALQAMLAERGLASVPEASEPEATDDSE